jgi:hypothetical protein
VGAGEGTFGVIGGAAGGTVGVSVAALGVGKGTLGAGGSLGVSGGGAVGVSGCPETPLAVANKHVHVANATIARMTGRPPIPLTIGIMLRETVVEGKDSDSSVCPWRDGAAFGSAGADKAPE